MMALSSLVYAQKTEKETDFALAFNDYCAGLTDSLYTYGTAWGEAFGKVYESYNFSQLIPHSNKIFNFIESSQKALIKRKVNPDMEDLKLAVLDFLAFEKVMIQEAFKPFEKFTDKTSDAIIKAQLDLLTAKSSQEEKALNTVRVEQEKMAKIYHFTMEAYNGE
ncbi:MAG: hypothetical protein EOP54_10945 [Sphingobacteriales bacterium]|nr:MAG: hypothetical protein EOP54_10945 [Sphingobacteriales bacterium]